MKIIENFLDGQERKRKCPVRHPQLFYLEPLIIQKNTIFERICSVFLGLFLFSFWLFYAIIPSFNWVEMVRSFPQQVRKLNELCMAEHPFDCWEPK